MRAASSSARSNVFGGRGWALNRCLVQRLERASPLINPDCGSILLDHGQRTGRAVAFMHGITSSPVQFRQLGELFHARGANYQSLGAGTALEPPAVAGVEKSARETVRISGARRFTPGGFFVAAAVGADRPATNARSIVRPR